MENLKAVKNTFTGFIIAVSIGFTVLYTLHSIFAANHTVTSLSTSDETEEITDHTNSDSIMIKILKIDIVSEVDNYIDKIAPKNDIDSELLFDLCVKYNIDIRFVIAQGQIESHFATKGTAKKTKSIFNVGAYDGHSAARQTRNGFGFDNANDSIEPYLILLTNDYLVNGKTEYNMMQNYVNYLGKRYASNPNYERMLKSVFNKINTTTNLDILLKEYNELKLT